MIEQILERIATALENLDARVGAIVLSLSESEECEEDLDRTTGVAITPPIPMGEGDSDSAVEMEVSVTPGAIFPVAVLPTDIRAEFLTRCKKLGITVPARTRTNTLRKWVAATILEGAKRPEYDRDNDIVNDQGSSIVNDQKVVATLQPSTLGEPTVCTPVGSPPIHPGPEETETVYTRDDVRIALIDLCKKKNNNIEICRGILTSHGATSVSDLDESKFADVMARIQDNGDE